MPDNNQKPVTMSLVEWQTEGRRLFGDDANEWKFRCPVCGNIQTPGDFRNLGVDPQSAYQECIGRHLPSRASDFASKPGKDGQKSPCDYAAFGLFRFGWAVVTASSSEPVPVFPFAVPPDAEPES